MAEWGEMLHCKMASLQEEMLCCKIAKSLGHVAGRHCRGRHQGNESKESQGFGGAKTQETEGTVGTATGDIIVKMAGCDEDMSLGFGSTGEELMDETQIFEVVDDHLPGDLLL